MKRGNNACLIVVLLFWCATAYAQYVSKPSFGDELIAVSRQTWFFVGCFALAGIVWRVLIESAPTRPRMGWHGYLSTLVLGAFAAFIGFYFCEMARAWGFPMLDGLQGGVISVCAYNNRRWLQWFSSRVEAGADAGAAAWKGFKTGGK